MRVSSGVRKRAAEATQRISRVMSVREVIAGRYEITSLIGRGGMAEVFAARDRKLERIVAIKRRRRDAGDDAAICARLHREAVALAIIDSPHVVAIHDVGSTPDGVYLVMQRLVGRTLEDEIDLNGPVTPARACRIARDILAGLAAVHDCGLVHRDLKASNVLLDRRDRAVLLDLGAALHPRKRPLTAPGTVLGTPAYLAPEQLAQQPLDGRVDLFQLGLILIFLVTGALVERAVDPSLLTIPAALREVITRALAPVSARYASAGEMRRALDQALAACTLEPIEPLIPRRPTLRWPALPPRP